MAKAKKAAGKPRTVAYLRVSTIDQDTEKNKADILTLANEKDFGKVEWIEEKVSGKKNWKERKIKQVIDGLCEGDRLIVPELSRLGRSRLEIMEMLSIAKDNHAWAKYLSDCALNLDYSNVKGNIIPPGDLDREDAYYEVWDALHRWQNGL